MPPRTALNVRAFRQISNEPYVCSSCLLKASKKQSPPRPIHTRLSTSNSRIAQWQTHDRARPRVEIKRQILEGRSKRHASNGSLASITAINAPTAVPQAHRELYQRLLVLQDTASSYADLSRLKLALRSLESSSPVIRVALLGLGNNGALAARRLARVLLGDALSDEQPWEKELLESANNEKTLLLRYGDIEESAQSSPMVQTMHIPSLFLQRHNLEILVSTFNGEGSSADGQPALEEALLVPPLTTPNAADGRVGFVRYPVHKAVLVAEGITGAVAYGRFPPTLTGGGLINAALSVPLRSTTGVSTGEQDASTNAVDVDLATHALSIFRANKANGAQFSDEWQTSRVSALSDWMTGQNNTTSGLNPAVRNLISSVLSNASTSVSVSEDGERALVTANTIPDSKRALLQSAITAWSADAHRDLQSNLDTAFSTSASWRRTSWWRLFWRIDDVTISASDVLRRSWLAEAEQRLAYLSGRIYDSGLATEEQLPRPSPVLLDKRQQAEMEDYEANNTKTETMAELTQMPSMLSQMQQQSGINALFNPPWPQTINLSRQYMLHALVPDLHRMAQALLLRTLSTIGGSAALGAWFYVATAGLGLYESGAIVALGLVWSLRRLQKRWTTARNVFASTVREDARRVLGEVESHLRTIVNEGGRASVRLEDERSWLQAREAVENCKEALGRLREGR